MLVFVLLALLLLLLLRFLVLHKHGFAWRLLRLSNALRGNLYGAQIGGLARWQQTVGGECSGGGVQNLTGDARQGLSFGKGRGCCGIVTPLCRFSTGVGGSAGGAASADGGGAASAAALSISFAATRTLRFALLTTARHIHEYVPNMVKCSERLGDAMKCGRGEQAGQGLIAAVGAAVRSGLLIAVIVFTGALKVILAVILAGIAAATAAAGRVGAVLQFLGQLAAQALVVQVRLKERRCLNS